MQSIGGIVSALFGGEELLTLALTFRTHFLLLSELNVSDLIPLTDSVLEIFNFISLRLENHP